MSEPHPGKRRFIRRADLVPEMRGLLEVTACTRRVTLGQAHPSMRERGARNERLAFEQGGDPRELIGSRAGHLQVARRHRDFDLRLEEGRAAELGVRL